MKARSVVAVSAPLTLLPAGALGHTSEQSFVLLLPTDLYISAGILAVNSLIRANSSLALAYGNTR